MCRGLVGFRPREYLGSWDRGTRLAFQTVEKRNIMYRPYHAWSVAGERKGGSAERSGKGKTGVMVVAYLFGFFCTDIYESPSTDKGDSGLATGAVGTEVGLSPSKEMGEEGWSGPEVTGSPLCGRGFLRT